MRHSVRYRVLVSVKGYQECRRHKRLHAPNSIWHCTFFTAADAGLLQAGYPPFGISDVSFVQLSSFMILIGLYYSATSVANDLKLRKSIKHSAREELKLLDNIGTAQTINETQNKVLEVTKRNAQSLVNNTGVELSLTDDEMRRYINDAIEEANKLRAKK